MTTSRILLNHTDVTKAGMDLHKAKKTVTNDTSILFVLPPPQILSHSIAPASFKIVDLDNAISRREATPQGEVEAPARS